MSVCHVVIVPFCQGDKLQCHHLHAMGITVSRLCRQFPLEGSTGIMIETVKCKIFIKMHDLLCYNGGELCMPIRALLSLHLLFLHETYLLFQKIIKYNLPFTCSLSQTSPRPSKGELILFLFLITSTFLKSLKAIKQCFLS